MKRIETLEQWKMLSEALTEKGYRLWQMQYSWNMPDGFYAKTGVDLLLKSCQYCGKIHDIKFECPQKPGVKGTGTFTY